MSNVTWQAYGTADNLIGTASINSLADGSGVILDQVDNRTDKKRFGDLLIILGADVTSVGTDARIDVYLVPAPDGTNYPDPPGSTAADVTEGYYVGYISSVKRAGTVTNFLSGVLRGIELPPTKFKLVVFNELGASFGASGHTVSLYRYGEAVA